MTEVVGFVAAVVALLAVPGPTNTLLAASGAMAGVRRSLPLLLGEGAGYTLAISVWLLIHATVAPVVPWLSTAVRLLAAAYLLWCAWRLFRQHAPSGPAEGAPIGIGRVFVVTLFNPKALIFAVAVFPEAPLSGLVPYGLVFLGLAAVVAIGWISLGRAMARAGGDLVTPRRVARLAGVVLAAFAASIVVGVLDRTPS